MAREFFDLYEMVDAPSGYDLGEERRYSIPGISDSQSVGLTNDYRLIYPSIPESPKEEPKSNEQRAVSYSGPTQNVKMFSDKKEFVRTMMTVYQQELSKKGLDPNYARVLVAQDALETGWGAKVKGDYNFGNITTNGNDWHKRTGNHKWKDFSSLQAYVNYKIDFLSNKRYRYFQTFSANSNVATSMQVLANRGYCPGSPSYGQKIAQVYKTMSKYMS